MTIDSSWLLGFGFPGGYEWIILLVLGLLIFGRRLPEVGRSLGKGIVEFKRGIKGIEDEIETESSSPKEMTGVPSTPGLEPPQPPPVSRESPQRLADASPPAETAEASAPEVEVTRAATDADHTSG